MADKNGYQPGFTHCGKEVARIILSPFCCSNNRKQSPPERPGPGYHEFGERTFRRARRCRICCQAVWTGSYCKECRYVCHKECETLVMTTCAPQQGNHQNAVNTTDQPFNLATYLAPKFPTDNQFQTQQNVQYSYTRNTAISGQQQQQQHQQGYSHYETLPGANREAVTVHRPLDRPQLKQTQSLGPAPPDRTIMATDIRNVDLRGRKSESFDDPFYDVDLHYITERIIAMSFPVDGHEAAYRNNMKDLARMLQTKHGHNYMVLNLSERRSDLTLYNKKVLEYGWPENLAPPLERLCSLCKEMDSWLNSDPQRVVVLHCKGRKGRTGVVIAAFMHYSNICASADQALDRFAMKRFYEDKLGKITQPSQKRYVHYFAGLLSGAIKINSSPLYLHQIILHGVPTFDDRTNGCRPFVKVYLAMEPIHTSGVYNLTDGGGMSRICFNVEPGLQLRGDVMIKAYHKRPHLQARDVIFRTQFHTCAISKFGYTLTKAELDDACTDRRFPDTGKVELLFSPGPQKQGPHFYHDPPPLLVDDSRDTIVRWDSYSEFARQQEAPKENGDANDSDLLSLDRHVQGPLDGSLYATITKQRTVTKETTSSTSSAAPVQHGGVSDVKDFMHNSMDSGISNSSTGGKTGVSVSVVTSQPSQQQNITYAASSTTRHSRAQSAPRNEFSSLRADPRSEHQELDAVLSDLLGNEAMITAPKSRTTTSYNTWESKSSTDQGGYVKRSYKYSDSADPSRNVSKTEYSSDIDALTRLLSLPAGYRQSPKADALDLAVPTENSHTWLEEQQLKLRKSHSRPRTEQERRLVEELKNAQDKFIANKSTQERSNYYTYIDDQSGYMSEPEGSSYRNKRYSKGYEPKYNTMQYSTTLVTDMNKPPMSPGLQRSMSPAVPSRSSSRDAMTRSRSATRGEWTSQNRPLQRQNSDLSHDRYNSPKGSPARPESPLSYRPTLHSASTTLERSDITRTMPHSRSTSFTYEPRVYSEQRVLVRNAPNQYDSLPGRYSLDREADKTYAMKDRLDLENALRQLEDLQSLTLDDARLDATRAPPDGNPDLQNSFGSSNADSSVSSLSREVFLAVNAHTEKDAHNISVSSISSLDKIHVTTPTYVQAVRVSPDVNSVDLSFTKKPGGTPRAEVTTSTRTVKHQRDKAQVPDEAVKHYNSLGERLEELERSLQAAQNAISAEAALRREKELREARDKDDKERLERARETRERLEREAVEREERLRLERDIIQREIREREIIEIREKEIRDRDDTDRIIRESRELERLRELERRERELLEKERQLKSLESAPRAPPPPPADVVDSGTRTITRTYMVEPSQQALDFKAKAKRRRSSVEDIYLLKPIGVHTLETDEPEGMHEIRAASTPIENRSATLPAAEALTPPFPVTPATPYVNEGGSHKLVEATVHRQFGSGHTESAGDGQHFFPGAGYAGSTGHVVGAGHPVGAAEESHHYSTIERAAHQGAQPQSQGQKLVKIHKTHTTETRRTDSPQLHTMPQQRHLESQRVEGRRYEGHTATSDLSPGFGDHYEVTTIRKEHQEQGPEVFVESGGSSLNQSFETSSVSAGGGYSYSTEARQASGAAGSTASLPHNARMNISGGSGDHFARTTTVTQESSPKQYSAGGSYNYTNEARNAGGGSASGAVHKEQYSHSTRTAAHESSPQYSFDSSPGVQQAGGGYSYSTSSQFGSGETGGKNVSIGGSSAHGESSGGKQQYSWSTEGNTTGQRNQSYSASSPGVQQAGGGYSYSSSSQFGTGETGGKNVSIGGSSAHGESSGGKQQYSWSTEGDTTGQRNQSYSASSPGVQHADGGYSYSTSSQFGSGETGGKNVSMSESSAHGESGGGKQQYSWSKEGNTTSPRTHQSHSESSSGGGDQRMNHSWSSEGASFSHGGHSASEGGGQAGGYSYQYSSQNGAQSPPTLTVDTSMVSHTRNDSSLSSNSFSPASPNSFNQLRSQLSKEGANNSGNFLSPNRQGSPSTSTYAGMSRQASMQSLAFKNKKGAPRSHHKNVDTVDLINHTPKFVKDLSKYWYKPNISREEAIVLLKDKSAGTFVVRDSNSFPGAFGLALKVSSLPPNVQSKGDSDTELVRHFLIESTSKGVRMKGCNNEPVFASLSTLIYQHTITPLALPCKLVLPESSQLDLDDTDSNKELVPGSAQALLAQGAACNVLYIYSVDTESLTGPQALARAMTETKKTQPKTTEVHFKVSGQGITLTDNLRKLFFRRHYPVNTVTYCGMDPDDTRWLTKQENGKEITAKVFGFVARKPGSQTDNSCHIFAELDPEQPASAIVNFVTKVMIGSHSNVKKS